MVRRLLAVGIALALSACSPADLWRWHAAQADPILKPVADQMARDYLATKEAMTAGQPCPAYYDAFVYAGFRPDQWPEPGSRIAYAESMCNPQADNPSSSAMGAMQVMQSIWQDDCDRILGSGSLYDLWWNMRCAFVVYGEQGWEAWVTF